LPFYLGTSCSVLVEWLTRAIGYTGGFHIFRFCGTIASIALRYEYGNMSYDSLGQIDGPYDVGYRKFFLRKGNGNTCSAFYPIGKGAQAKNSRPVFCFEVGNDPLQNSNKARRATLMGRFCSLAEVWLNGIKRTVIPVKREAEVTDQPLKPLLFSHGKGTNRLLYSGLCKQFAAHGFLVLAIDH
jgi:hypothetical protein